MGPGISGWWNKDMTKQQVVNETHLTEQFIFFYSVDDIIDHYKKEQIVEGYNLKEPVSIQVRTPAYIVRVFD